MSWGLSSSGSVQEHMTAVVNKVMNDSVPKLWRIPWLAEQLLVYQEGVSCMGLVVPAVIKTDYVHTV